jgi:aspartate/glutamate/glutamine transport system substrate-binding protein
LFLLQIVKKEKIGSLDVIKNPYAVLWLFFLIASFGSCSSGNSQSSVLTEDDSGNITSILQKIQLRGKLIVGTDYYLPGMGFLNPQTDKLEGFEPDLARILAKEILGDPSLVDFVLTMPDSRIAYLDSEIVDMIIANMTITEERKKFVDFSAPYYMAGQSILVKKGSSIKDVKDLNGKIVATGRATTNEENLKKLAPRAKIVLFDDIAQALAQLKDGKVDAISSDNIILYILKASAEDPNNYEVLKDQFSIEPWGIAVEKGQNKLVDIINQTLNRLKNDGGWKALYDKNLKPITGISDVSPP